MQLIQIDKNDRDQLRRFIEWPHTIYRGNPNWVPPLHGAMTRMLRQGSGMQLSGGPHILLAVEREGQMQGRLLAGVNQVKNQQRQQKEGYFSLFESADDPAAAGELFAEATSWWQAQGVDRVTGPVSPTNGDDHRGVLIQGFDRLPAVNTPYTQPYYPQLLEQLGFRQYIDFYAYRLAFDPAEQERVERLVAYGRKKIDLDIQSFDLRHIERDIQAVHEVLTEAMLPHWSHLEIPTYEQVRAELREIRYLIDPNLILIARIGGQPVGFVAGLPDYNQVLRHLDGHLGPLGMVKFLYYRSRISRARMFLQFVIPKYQRSVVIAALYAELFHRFRQRGYQEMEASTMAESNTAALAAVKGVGFITDRVYRIYQKDLKSERNLLDLDPGDEKGGFS